jgi:hypothetical protein
MNWAGFQGKPQFNEMTLKGLGRVPPILRMTPPMFVN